MASLLVLLSCRLDTESLTTVDKLARDIPNIVITKVTYKEIERAQLVQEVYADEFKLFSNDQLVYVTKGNVKTYEDGQGQLEGQAVSAKYNQETEDADVVGPIELYYYPEQTRITADDFQWIDKERRLSSKPEGVVKVEQDNGTNFQGKNFSVDMTTKTISYGQEVTGQLYAEGDSESEGSPGSSEENANEEPVSNVAAGTGNN